MSSSSRGRADDLVPEDAPPRLSRIRRIKHVLFGKPRDLADSRLFHRLSLIPFLAWVGLGADGLSSSAYGPEEAFKALGAHTYLAWVWRPSWRSRCCSSRPPTAASSRHFPPGGGGYVVATQAARTQRAASSRARRCWSTTC